MGIKHVNRYLVDRCSKKAIFKTNLKIAEGKIIVIDTSIYMYKYMSQNALVEYIYLMISILLEYKITPIFIFDGKAPPEKRDLLRERSKYKKPRRRTTGAFLKLAQGTGTAVLRDEAILLVLLLRSAARLALGALGVRLVLTAAAELFENAFDFDFALKTFEGTINWLSFFDLDFGHVIPLVVNGVVPGRVRRVAKVSLNRLFCVVKCWNLPGFFPFFPPAPQPCPRSR